jgi:hypothetical protein
MNIGIDAEIIPIEVLYLPKVIGFLLDILHLQKNKISLFLNMRYTFCKMQDTQQRKC